LFLFTGLLGITGFDAKKTVKEFVGLPLYRTVCFEKLPTAYGLSQRLLSVSLLTLSVANLQVSVK